MDNLSKLKLIHCQILEILQFHATITAEINSSLEINLLNGHALQRVAVLPCRDRYFYQVKVWKFPQGVAQWQNDIKSTFGNLKCNVQST